MTLEQIEARRLEIAELIKNEDADLEALNAEIDALAERKTSLEAEKRDALNEVIENKEVEIIKEIREEKTMDLKEIRNSQEYARAYANFILNEDDKEVRALLSENATSGKFPVPEILANKIAHAWEDAKLFNGVAATSLKGNIRIGFEISADGANIHIEGGEAVAEENITLGVEEFKAISIKKFITASDEVLDLNGEEVLDYLYTEMAYRIVKKAQEKFVADTIARPATSSATQMGVKVYTLTATPKKADMIMAKALLSDEASDDLVFIANKNQIASMKTQTTADGYPIVDIFDGCDTVAENTIKDYASASAGNVVGLIVDRQAILLNRPNGDELTFKIDENSLAEADLVKIVGRQFVAMGLKAPYRAVVIKK